jgi:AcrR family transcriptional regulator
MHPCAYTGPVPTLPPALRPGGDRSTPRDQRENEQIRTFLLDAAESSFTTHGFAKTTMGDVAAAAGVSRRTLYRYFANRDELVLAFLVRAQRAFHRRAAKVIAVQPSFADAVVEAMALAVRTGPEDPHVAVILRPDSASVASSLIGGSAVFYDVAAELWLPLLERGIAAGEARPDLVPDRACRWVLEVELMLATRVLDGTLKEREIKPLIREFVLPGLVAAADRE